MSEEEEITKRTGEIAKDIYSYILALDFEYSCVPDALITIIFNYCLDNDISSDEMDKVLKEASIAYRYLYEKQREKEWKRKNILIFG